MAKINPEQKARETEAARELIAVVTDWLIDDDGAHWRPDVNGANFVDAMTRAVELYRRAVGLPALTDRYAELQRRAPKGTTRENQTPPSTDQ